MDAIDRSVAAHGGAEHVVVAGDWRPRFSLTMITFARDDMLRRVLAHLRPLSAGRADTEFILIDRLRSRPGARSGLRAHGHAREPRDAARRLPTSDKSLPKDRAFKTFRFQANASAIRRDTYAEVGLMAEDFFYGPDTGRRRSTMPTGSSRPGREPAAGVQAVIAGRYRNRLRDREPLDKQLDANLTLRLTNRPISSHCLKTSLEPAELPSRVKIS